MEAQATRLREAAEEFGPVESFATATAATPEERREIIARRAFELYLERGGAEGQALEDWLKAEGETREAAARQAELTD